MPIDLSTVDLDQPAFPLQGEENVPANGSQPTKVYEVEEPATVPADGTVPEGQIEEQKVPYSRMKAVIERARRAEQEAEEAREYARSVESQRSEYRPERLERQSERSGDSMYDDGLNVWIKLYGDKPETREAYRLEYERQERLRDSFRNEALEAVRQERTQESQIFAQNERTLDERLEDLSYSLGRGITPDEESAILDIVDEYTPTGSDGRYAGEILPMDKAWEIYNLRISQATRGVSERRRMPTALTGARTEGVPTNREKENKDWIPGDWNSYQKKIPNGY